MSSSKEKIDSKNSFQISELDRKRERERHFFPAKVEKVVKVKEIGQIFHNFTDPSMIETLLENLGRIALEQG